jgi:hypothetical protein
MAEYKDYTDEEYDALDEYYTKNTIMPVGGKPGAFTRWKQRQEKSAMMVTLLDTDATLWVKARAEAEHHTPSEVVTELVRREMAYA